jgi:hypothetical protein
MIPRFGTDIEVDLTAHESAIMIATEIRCLEQGADLARDPAVRVFWLCSDGERLERHELRYVAGAEGRGIGLASVEWARGWGREDKGGVGIDDGGKRSRGGRRPALRCSSHRNSPY